MIQKHNIEKADIIFLSADMLDIFVDLDYYYHNNLDIDFKKIANTLNNESENIKIKWNDTTYSDFGTEDLRLSESSFFQLTNKDYITFAKLDDLDVPKYIESSNEAKKILAKYDHISRYIEALDLRISCVELKFSHFGEVSFTAKCSLREVPLDIDVYISVTHLLRELIGIYYRGIVIDAFKTYTYVLRKLALKKDGLLIYEAPYFDEDENINNIIKNSFHSVTWCHYIYNNDLYELDDWLGEFSRIVDSEPNCNNIDQVNNAKVFIGWSHSIFLFKNLDENKNRIEIFKYPIEDAWCQYMFFTNINKTIDRLTSDCYQILINKKKGSHKLTNYKYKIDSFYYLVTKMVDAFAAPTTTTYNPYQLEILRKQNNIWLRDELKETFARKSSSLKEIIEYINNSKNRKSNNLLNWILTIIAFLSVIDISNAVIELFSCGDYNKIIASLGPSITLFLIIYVYRRINNRV